VEWDGLASLMAEHAAGLPAPGRVAAVCNVQHLSSTGVTTLKKVTLDASFVGDLPRPLAPRPLASAALPLLQHGAISR